VVHDCRSNFERWEDSIFAEGRAQWNAQREIELAAQQSNRDEGTDILGQPYTFDYHKWLAEWLEGL
jgi:hypothetical protein